MILTIYLSNHIIYLYHRFIAYSILKSDNITTDTDSQHPVNTVWIGLDLECAPQSGQLVKVCLREGKHGKNIEKKLYT